MTIPRLPTREDYIAMGVNPAALDRMAAERIASRGGETVHETIARCKREVREESEAKARAQRAEPGYRVLNLTEEQEAAASRFMDEEYRTGAYRHAMASSPKHAMIIPPSTIWAMGWCTIGTAHMGLSKIFLPAHGRRKLHLPCSFQAMMEFAAYPAIDKFEAHHRAESFAQDALDRARRLYREGFYADPFAAEPKPRPPDVQA